MKSLPFRNTRYPSLPAGLVWLRLLFQAGWALAPAWTVRRLWHLMRTPRRPRPNGWEARVLCEAHRGLVSGPVGPVMGFLLHEYPATGEVYEVSLTQPRTRHLLSRI
ncbi:hypothetical protein [Hymenobacter mucosus]|uniref:Uncharacterized protein n=1 Tax=Hymenobacter mucosus TaxID=1411120 RepID=A0A239BGE6_9BACT|nr:hypothetical protein [Hymenobacter mucosus]SNS06702.1 hypothetical protein SAMN06269173_12314 [Hymenobacter mucosus]